MAEFITTTTNAPELVAKFRRLAPHVRAGVVKGLKGALLVTEGRVRRGAGLKWRRGGAGLAGRLTSYARQGGRYGIDAAIGFRRTAGFPYEMSQEFGAKAKPGSAMTIPISPVARRNSERGGRARDLGVKLFRPNGTNVLLEARKRGEPVLHYVLVSSIPPRLRFRETVAASQRLIMDGVLDGARRAAAQAGAEPR